MPETPKMCIDAVAGKVIQLEQLHDEVEQARDFQSFFANVYCNAYVSSIVTMKDGLYQICPGGLDLDVKSELQRAFGPFTDAEFDSIETAAIATYQDAIDQGTFIVDSSILINEVTPLEDALKLCDKVVTDKIAQARIEREDYLMDYNFIRFLQTL